MYRVKPRTPGQERRRQAKIARRAERRNGPAEFRTMPKAARRSPFQWLKFRRVNRERAQTWAGSVLRRIAAMQSRTSDAPSCPSRRVYKENGQQVAGDPCGGKLKRVKLKRVKTGDYRCQSCGRDWTPRSHGLVAASVGA